MSSAAAAPRSAGGDSLESAAGTASARLQTAASSGPADELRARLFANKQLLGQRDGSRQSKPPSLLMQRGGAPRGGALSISGPPAPDEAAFSAVPVDAFGAALLRGMGASEEQLEGRDGVYEADAPRASKGEFLGLGADRDPRAEAEAADRRRRRQRNAHAAAADREREAASHARRQRFAGLLPGALARMAAGPYRGQLALIVQSEGVPGMDRMRARLQTAGSRVVRKVDADLVNESALGEQARAAAQSLREAERAEAEAEARAKAADAAAASAARLKTVADDSATPAGAASASRGQLKPLPGSQTAPLAPSEPGAKRARLASEAAAPGRGDALAWLLPGIRVRFADPTFKQGRFFKSKGVVEHADDASADVRAAGGEVVRLVPIAGLQTALPKAGGRVMMVRGAQRGRQGVLVSRSSAKGSGVVRLDAGARGEETVSLDDMAEWVGCGL